jgi:hypothetical protein
MNLIPEARITHEIVLNALRTLKYSGFSPDIQRVIMECAGKLLVLNSTQDTDIDERIKMTEDILYGDTRKILSEIWEEPEDRS